MNQELEQVLQPVLGETVRIESSYSVGGGCINQTQVLKLTSGIRVFMKYHPDPPKDFFKIEKQGLELLASAREGPRIPKSLALQPVSNAKYLLLEYLDEESPDKDYYERFGQALANMHRSSGEFHGLDHNNFIGKTNQINTFENDGLTFFRDHRLGFQQKLARKRGLLPRSTDKKIDALCDRLEHLLDLSGEQPALLHGDLWSGNHFTGPGGQPCIFDPAAYYGLRETDLAMTELFGKMPSAFYASYEEAFPLNPGYAERKDIYNLYHLLNHLNLFGGSYLGSVESTLNHFTR